mgnify:CR=1 FL=1
MTQEQWGVLQQDLPKTAGQNNYKTWIAPISFGELNDGVVTFHVPTNFIGNYVSQNYGDLILHQLTKSGAAVRRIAFKVAANTTARPVQQQAITSKPEESRESDMAGAPLDPRFTFDSFVVGKPNELANAAANPYVFVPGPTYSDMFGILLKYIAQEKPGANVAFFYSDMCFSIALM